jgi:hypothetical protein
MISRWKHILTRNTTHRSLNLSRSFRSRHSANIAFSSQNEIDIITLDAAGAYTGAGSDKGVETFVSSGGSTLADRVSGEKESAHSDEGPVSLMAHVTRMGRRPSAPNVEDPDADPQRFTVTKEIYIKEERVKSDDDDSPV